METGLFLNGELHLLNHQCVWLLSLEAGQSPIDVMRRYQVAVVFMVVRSENSSWLSGNSLSEDWLLSRNFAQE